MPSSRPAALARVRALFLLGLLARACIFPADAVPLRVVKNDAEIDAGRLRGERLRRLHDAPEGRVYLSEGKSDCASVDHSFLVNPNDTCKVYGKVCADWYDVHV